MNGQTVIRDEECIDWLYAHIEEYLVSEELSCKKDFCFYMERKSVYFSRAVKAYKSFASHTVRNPVAFRLIPAPEDEMEIQPLSVLGYFIEADGKSVPVGLLQEKGIFENEVKRSFEGWKDEALERGEKAFELILQWQKKRMAQCEFVLQKGLLCIWDAFAGFLTAGEAVRAVLNTRPYWEKVNWYAVLQTKITEEVPWKLAKSWYFSGFSQFDRTSRIILVCAVFAFILAVTGLSGMCGSLSLVPLYRKQAEMERVKRQLKKLTDKLKTMTWKEFCCLKEEDYKICGGLEIIRRMLPEKAGRLDTPVQKLKRGGKLRWLLLAVIDAAVVKHFCTNIVSLWR